MLSRFPESQGDGRAPAPESNIGKSHYCVKLYINTSISDSSITGVILNEILTRRFKTIALVYCHKSEYNVPQCTHYRQQTKE
jgi:hypothetical protein